MVYHLSIVDPQKNLTEYYYNKKKNLNEFEKLTDTRILYFLLCLAQPTHARIVNIFLRRGFNT